tara:strand:+ start:6457 stop:6822 length:366 start_codon:yes stop_codon:yes gene_type:complete
MVLNMSARLKTNLWVQAQVRLCGLNFIPMAVTRRGDPDAGAVLLKLLRKDGLCRLLRRTTTFDGEQGWVYAIAPNNASFGDVAEATADGYIERESARDQDLWVVEIEDYEGRYEIDGPIEM